MENNSKDEKEYTWRNIPLGKEVELATIKIKLTGVEETKKLKSSFSSDIAKEGTKFVLITAEIENITKDPLPFNNEIPLHDNQDRRFNPYEDAIWYTDNAFSYVELAPNIKETGTIIYNVPDDSTDYSLKIIKDGTDEGYVLLTR